MALHPPPARQRHPLIPARPRPDHGFAIFANAAATIFLAFALSAALGTAIQGAVAAGTLTNSAFPTNVSGFANYLIVGRTLTFLTGANAKQSVQVLSYNGSTGVIGTSPMIGAPSVADQFIVQ